jgi:hypothetical protein
MVRSLHLSVCLVATAPLWAQGTFVSPPAFAAVEGDAYAYHPCVYADAHYQLGDGELRGKALALTQVSFRLDYQNHNSNSAMGRKWTEVALSLSDTDWTQFTSTFAKNQLSTPVEVFKGAIEWPTVQGTPFNQPTPFGGKYAFPFTSPYNYAGTKDLLMDFFFRGGTMANAAVWSGATYYYYDLDADNTAISYSSARTYYPASEPNPRCRDSAIVGNYSAYIYATLEVHGAIHSNVTYRDKARFEMYGYYTAPSARIITAIAFGGNANGVNIGARCNHLYPNLQGPWLALGRTTDANSYSGIFSAFAPWSPAMSNVPIWVQSAWDDSVLKTFSLTRAMMVTMPKDKPRPAIKVSTHHYTSTSANGFGPYLGTYLYNPISQFTYK